MITVTEEKKKVGKMKQTEEKWNACGVNSYTRGKQTLRPLADIHRSMLRLLKLVTSSVLAETIRLYMNGFLLPRKEIKYHWMDFIRLF